MAEIDALEARLDKATLPVAQITFRRDAPFDPVGSRVGGRPFADSPRRQWPHRGDQKVPMLFIAQINFSELPPMQDFPTHGILHLFGVADQKGHLGSTDTKPSRVIRWFPEPQGTLTLHLPDSLEAQTKLSTLSPRAILTGLAMSFEAGMDRGDPANWPFEKNHGDACGNPPQDQDVKLRQDKLIKDFEDDSEVYEGKSWVGGQPSFVQGDVRYEPRLRKLNRVLLHLKSDYTDISLGDFGSLNLMISRKALAERDFDQAYCTWDCH